MIEKVAIKTTQPKHIFQCCSFINNTKLLNDQKMSEFQCRINKQYLSQTYEFQTQGKRQKQVQLSPIVKKEGKYKISIRNMLKMSPSHNNCIAETSPRFNQQFKSSKRSINQVKSLRKDRQIKLGAHLQTCISINSRK